MYQSPSMESQPCQTMDNPKPLSGFAATTLQKVRNNLAFRSKWLEVNGAMGDLGTYIPIVLALTLAKDLNLGTTLIFTAIYNILTGALYGLPMPVQPMKSIAAVAISNGSSFGYLRLIPLPVVRGVQLSQGLSFAMTAVSILGKSRTFPSLSEESRGGGSDDDGGLGVTKRGLGRGEGGGDEDWAIPYQSSEDIQACLEGGVHQGCNPPIAFIVAKLCDAVCKAIIRSFPREELLSDISVSDCWVDEFSGVLVWSHAMLPWCRGASWAVQVWGKEWWVCGTSWCSQAGFGIVLGSSLAKLLNQFPVGVLGVLLLFAGIELAMASRDMASKEESFVMLLCAAVSLVGSSAAIGFVCGIIVHLLLRLRNMTQDQSCSTTFGNQA
ncbi:Molybdate transporter 2 [Vitis vinifera]|uniref:Molybdate transporter 2 n=1 Tax=Vitis vinifera TaxID=29760 RepID=A0A438KE70_VITVI|nr:Molybdate transporter 2 [Vitis vinifera]